MGGIENQWNSIKIKRNFWKKQRIDWFFKKKYRIILIFLIPYHPSFYNPKTSSNKILAFKKLKDYFLFLSDSMACAFTVTNF